MAEHRLGEFEGFVDLAAYYSRSEGQLHVLVARSDGTLLGRAVPSQAGFTPIMTLPGVKQVTAFEVAREGYDALFALLEDGVVTLHLRGSISTGEAAEVTY